MEHSRPNWSPPPRLPAAVGGEVHVWRAALGHGPALVERMERLLAPDERERAARFHFRRDRERFVVARGILRDILGRYLGARPERLRFRYNAYGKPALAGEYASEPLGFNLSHSHDVALYAVARGREVGVDVELMRPDLAGEDIALGHFSAAEVSALRALTAGQRVEAFFFCWTRKEAFVKARGEGLSLPLDQFTVSLTPGEPARLLRVEGEPREVGRWSLCELHPGEGYAGALAARGVGWQLKLWQWPEALEDSRLEESRRAAGGAR